MHGDRVLSPKRNIYTIASKAQGTLQKRRREELRAREREECCDTVSSEHGLSVYIHEVRGSYVYKTVTSAFRRG